MYPNAFSQIANYDLEEMSSTILTYHIMTLSKITQSYLMLNLYCWGNLLRDTKQEIKLVGSNLLKTVISFFVTE